MKIPFSVLINRSDESTRMINDYCESESIKVIGEIPFSRKAAEMYSKGLMLTEDIEFKEIFHNIAFNLNRHVSALVEVVGEVCK